MKTILHFEPLTKAGYDTYIRIGTKAYNQHYLHLWPNEDSSPYITNSFTLAVLAKEEKNEGTCLFLINRNTECVGILKFTMDKALGELSKEKALYIDKLYIIREASGLGIGTKVLRFVGLRAKALKKSLIWLETMQKGPALHFYIKNGFKLYGTTEIPFPAALEKEKPMFIMTKEIT